MTIASKHGKVAKLDFLFHKTGPQKGKPRGYAFVEYATREVRAISHDSVRLRADLIDPRSSFPRHFPSGSQARHDRSQ